MLSALKPILPDACPLLPVAQQLQGSLVSRECDTFPCGTLPVLYPGPGQNGNNLRVHDGNCDKSFEKVSQELWAFFQVYIVIIWILLVYFH